jgi:4-amino-4-deoxy-L-arabinose transferase-like glycosyltransferase
VSSLALPVRSEPSTAVKTEPSSRLILCTVLLFCGALFTITLTGLPQFMDNEWRLSAYVLDILQNGRFFCPTDANGDVISKPPMLAWLAALGAALTGSVNAFAMYWPTAAATAVTTALLFVFGRKYFGWRAGLFGAMAYAVSYIGLSQMSMPRYDGLLALPITAAAFAAFSAWQTGRGWTWFWFFAALGTLVKGPIAVLLPGFGLLAYFWERRSQPLQKRVARSQLPGILLFFVITAGWFALAYLEMGKPLLDKMLGRELVAHAVERTSGPLSGFAEPTKAFLGIYAPWSVIAVAGFWRVVRSPSTDAVQRRLERFLFLWFVLGLIMFSVAAHQRGRPFTPSSRPPLWSRACN